MPSHANSHSHSGMKAIVFDQFGEPADVLQVREVPTPTPGPGEVRIKMLMTPINPSDLMTVRGVYGKKPTLPATPGYEGVGIVESAGPGLFGKLLVGKRVVVLNRGTGNWSDFTVIPARQAIPISDRISTEQAAMFFVNPTTAYVMTRKVLSVPSGQWLLQTAAGSALGKMVIRLGKRFGFRTLNIVRREEQVAELKSLGGDAVIAAGPDDLQAKVREATGGKGVPFAIDPVGGALASAALRCLAPRGRMLVFGTLTGESLSFSSRDLMTPGTTLEGFWLTNYMDDLGLLSKLMLVRKVAGLIVEGTLSSEIGNAFSLDQVREAVLSAEKVGRGGKTLLKIAAP